MSKRKQKYPAKERTENARRLRSPTTGPVRTVSMDPQRQRELKMANGASIILRDTTDNTDGYGIRTQFAWVAPD